MKTENLFGVKPTESYSANDYRSIVIYGINFSEANSQIDSLKNLGIINIEEIKSIKKDKTINMVKAICNNSITAKNLITSKIKIGYERFRVAEFKRKKTLIVCYDCALFGHKQGSNKCKGIKCYGCGSKDHIRFNCPDKDDRSKDKCPNCDGNHPATYAGCQVFKQQLNKLYGKKQNNNHNRNKDKLVTASSSNKDVDLNKFNYTKKDTKKNKSIDDLFNELQKTNDEIKKTNKSINNLNNNLLAKIEGGFDEVEIYLRNLEDRILFNNSSIISFMIHSFYKLGEKTINKSADLNTWKNHISDLFKKSFDSEKDDKNRDYFKVKANQVIADKEYASSKLFFTARKENEPTDNELNGNELNNTTQSSPNDLIDDDCENSDDDE
jgi:hypothetical protein